MELTFYHFLLICPMVFLAGFVDAIAGGGGLISLPAYLISGLPAHTAMATNKMSATMGATISAWRYAKAGYIRWREAIVCVFCAIVGSACGARLALLLDDRVFRIFMLVVIPTTGAYIILRKNVFSEKAPYSFSKTLIISAVVALVIGVYDGFYGPGTGTFLILLLTGLSHMGLNEANGTAKAINFASNVSALAVFLLNGKVLLPLGLTAGCFNLVGSYLGTKCFDRKGVKVVKPIMIAVLVIFFAKTVVELAGG